MAANQNDIRNWFLKGKEEEATHMLVVCDTFDWTDYPIYVQSDEQVQAKIEQYQGNMQKVMEVYNLALDIDAQLRQWNFIKGKRAWNI